MLTTQEVRDKIEDCLLDLQYQDVEVRGLGDDTILARWKENEDDPDEAALQIVVNPNDYPYGVDLEDFEPGEIPSRDTADTDVDELREELTKSQEAFNELQKTHEDEVKRKETDITELDEKAKTYEKRVEELEGELEEAKKELDKAEKANKKAK